MKVMARSLYRWMVNSPKYKNNVYKRIKLKVRMTLRGFVAFLISRKYNKKPIFCDVLLIHPSYKSYRQGRKKKLISMLKDKGLIVKEFIEKKDREKLISREFCKIKEAPLLFKWEAYHANYILSKYQAKVILTERNGWVLPSFIKKIRRSDSLIVHMAHSIPTMQSSKYNYYDYDYYFLYGKSSYSYLNKLDCSFGSCKVLFKGPYFFYSNRKYIKRSTAVGNITFICSGPDYEKKLSYMKVCTWIEKLVKDDIVDKLYIKCHPRGDNKRWMSISKKYPGRVELVSNDNFHDCLDDSQYAVMNYTNAIIDMAYYGIPVLVAGETADYFSISEFSIPWAKSYNELIDYINVDNFGSQAEFSRYHLENTYNASQSLVESIWRLVEENKSLGFFKEVTLLRGKV